MTPPKKRFENGLFVICIIFLLFSVNLASSTKCNQKPLFEERNCIYYSYDQLTYLIGQLNQEYPGILSYHALGKTYEGRDIWLVKISDNVTVDENEPKVLFMGGVHGHERPGCQVVMYTIKAIAENYTLPNVNNSFTMRVRNIVNNTELYFIPMVNPDGVEADNRKNQRPNRCIFGKTLFCGVDINRNFGYKWEEFYKHPFKYAFGDSLRSMIRANVMYPFLDFGSIKRRGNYRGPCPFSENESRAIKQFVENNSILLSVDYHTRGEKIIYPWSWTKDPPPDKSFFLSVAGNISQINGYEVVQGSHWYYISGASKDWLYGEHGVFPFAIELCKSDGPYTPHDKELILHLCKTHLLVNIYLAERAVMMTICS